MTAHIPDQVNTPIKAGNGLGIEQVVVRIEHVDGLRPEVRVPVEAIDRQLMLGLIGEIKIDRKGSPIEPDPATRSAGLAAFCSARTSLVEATYV